MKARVREEKITRTALILVGHVLGETRFRESKLYDQSFPTCCATREKEEQGGGVSSAQPQRRDRLAYGGHLVRRRQRRPGDHEHRQPQPQRCLQLRLGLRPAGVLADRDA